MLRKPDKLTPSPTTWLTVFLLLWTATILWLSESPVGKEIDRRLARPLDFHSREALGRSPEIDPRLKIFAFDDSTYAHLARPKLFVNEWVRIFQALDKTAPKAVLVDQIFSMFPKNEAGTSDLAHLPALTTPIVAGAFVTSAVLKQRGQIDFDRSDYTDSFLISYLPKPQPGANIQNPNEDPDQTRLHQALATILANNELPPVADRLGYKVYGPAKEFNPLFGHVGHINYNSDYRMFPVMRIKYDRFIPSISLFAAPYQFRDGALISNDHPVPVNDDGSILVNFAPNRTFYKKVKRITKLLKPAMTDKAIKGIKPGDVVLILPGMFTGSTDFKDGPFGSVPGGLAQAAMVNSVLTGQWLQEVPWPSLQIVAYGLVGFLLGFAQSTLVFWVALVFANIAIIGIGLGGFAFLGLVFPWAWSAFSLTGCAIMVFAKRSYHLEVYALELEIIKIRKEHLEREMATASKMAEAFLPDKLPHWASVGISSFHKTFEDASGDWFAYATPKHGKFFHFVLCDITGHGLQAALVVSSCKTTMSLIKAHEPELLEQDDFIITFKNRLNGLLFEQGRGHHITTLCGITFYPYESRLKLIAAGHPRPFFVGADARDERPRTIKSASNLIGYEASHDATMVEHRFGPGDFVIAYTDGYPTSKLNKALKGHLALTNQEDLDQLATKLQQDIWQHDEGVAVPDDDLSLVVFSNLLVTGSGSRQTS